MSGRADTSDGTAAPGPRSLAARFLAWWGGELGACLPSLFRDRGRRRRRLLVDLDGAALVVKRRRRGGKVKPVARIALGDQDASQASKSRRAVGRAARRSDEVVLRVPEREALQRTIRLPMAARENLREVIGFEMDRFTSLKAEEAYFDFEIAETDEARQQLAVALMVVPRADLRPALDLLAAWGVVPDRLVLLRPDEDAEFGRNLLPPAPAAAGLSWQARLGGGLAVVLLLLLGAQAYLPWYEKQQQLEALQAREAALRAEALQVDGLRTQVAAEAKRRAAIYATLTARPPAIRVLDELSRIIPDGTWLVDLQVSGETVSLKGYSQEPAGVIAVLEASPLFHDARFVSPVIPDSRIGLDRIAVSARLVAVERQP